MPSPFPGMDPYLEHPNRWGGVHAAIIAAIRERLSRQVAPRFFVDSEDHVYILGLGDPGRTFFRPDMYIREAAMAGAPSPSSARIAAPVEMEIPESAEVRAPFLTIIDTLDYEVVTTIELLSPINKVVGSSGRDDFLRKREHVFCSHTHWLEIDLLRVGERSPNVYRDGAYCVVRRRADGLNRLEGWFVGLRQRLPTVGVPLRPPFEDVPLDLQEVIETVYDRYRYDAAIDYTQDPPRPSLSMEDLAWARERIAAWRPPGTGPLDS